MGTVTDRPPGIVTCWVLRKQDRPVLAGRDAVVFRPLGDPALEDRDLFLGEWILLERHPGLAVESDQLDQAALVGLAGLERDALRLAGPPWQAGRTSS